MPTLKSGAHKKETLYLTNFLSQRPRCCCYLCRNFRRWRHCCCDRIWYYHYCTWLYSFFWIWIRNTRTAWCAQNLLNLKYIRLQQKHMEISAIDRLLYIFIPRHNVDIEKARRQHKLPQRANRRVTEVMNPITFLPIFYHRLPPDIPIFDHEYNPLFQYALILLIGPFFIFVVQLNVNRILWMISIKPHPLLI